VISESRRFVVDFPTDKLVELAEDYVQRATSIVREQERLVDQLRGDGVEHPLTQRVVEALSKAASAVNAYESLLRELKAGGNE
jgi:hypothetical protein